MSNASPSDSLLNSLVFLTAHYGRAKSAEAIKAGLAYDENSMGPALFQEAAGRLGFKTNLVKKELKKIDPANLPVVLVMADKKALVLLEIKAGAFKVYDPATGAQTTLQQQHVEKDYTGSLLLVYPSAEFRDPSKQDPLARHWFWSAFKENTATYRDVVICAVLINLFGLVSPIFIMNVYDRVIPNNAIETGWVLGIAALIIFVFDFIIRTLRGYFIDFAGRRIDVKATRRIYDQVLDMKLSQRPKSSGAFANTLKDFDSVRDFMTSATITGFVDLPFTVFYLFVIYMFGGALAILLLGLIIVVLAAGYALQLRLKYYVRQSSEAAEAKHGLLVETIHGLETIKAIGADHKFRARYSQETGEHAYWGQKSRFVSAMGVNIATFFQQSASIILVLMGMYMVQDGTLSMGALIACVILSGRALSPIGQMANLMTRYHQAMSSMRIIDKLMDKPVDRPAHVQFLHRPHLKGAVTFDKVSFSYPGSTRKILDAVSFQIKAGEKVGLIGRIGSGKSTIARLVMDLYDPTEGTILFDETDERQIDPADLRRNIGYIAQDVTLFSGTVRDNIIAARPQATDAEILEAAKKAGVDEFISKHPSGYDAPIGERGEGLSGGQRQAIALARAMLLKPAIYVCDEPTNAMDVQAEEAFSQHMREEARDKTLILITHRQSLLAMVSRLIVVDQGRIVMDGTRDEVMRALSGGGNA